MKLQIRVVLIWLSLKGIIMSIKSVAVSFAKTTAAIAAVGGVVYGIYRGVKSLTGDTPAPVPAPAPAPAPVTETTTPETTQA